MDGVRHGQTRFAHTDLFTSACLFVCLFVFRCVGCVLLEIGYIKKRLPTLSSYLWPAYNLYNVYTKCITYFLK